MEGNQPEKGNRLAYLDTFPVQIELSRNNTETKYLIINFKMESNNLPKI